MHRIFLLLIICISSIGCDISISKDKSKNSEEQDSELSEFLPWMKDSSRSTSMEMVELKLASDNNKELNLKIPKAYLTDRKNWQGGKQERIKIETGLPELLPRPANFWITEKVGTPEYEIAERKFENGLFIFLEAHSRDEQKSTLKQVANKWINHHEKFYVRQTNEKFDLLYFKDIQCSDLDKFSDEHLKEFIEDKEDAVINENKVCYSRNHEYFITPEKYNDTWVRFRCNSVKTSNKSKVQGGCTASTEYKTWSIKYIFRRNQLHRWKEFDNATRQFLDEFYVETNTT